MSCENRNLELYKCDLANDRGRTNESELKRRTNRLASRMARFYRRRARDSIGEFHIG